MKQFIITAFLSAAFMFTAPAAFGQEGENDNSGVYIGVAGGQFYDDPPPAPAGYEYTGDDNAGTFRLYGGYRTAESALPGDSLAIELSSNVIADLKLDCSVIPGGGEQTVEQGSISLVSLYHFHIGERFSVFPKLGVAYAEIDGGDGPCVTYSDDSALAPVFGGGMEFRISDNLAFRADIDKGTSGLDDEKFVWTAGLLLYF